MSFCQPLYWLRFFTILS
uniref:Uncharacterized protein n=1 Tax=Arundo donax TaxID=35708 RepID=A0A0A9CM38_ARUDO